MSILALLFGVVVAACGGGSIATPPAGGGGPAAPSGGGTDTPPAAPSAPAVTPVGRALGQAASARIGPAGGTLVSGDGQATLVVPAGALAADTEISMTPLSSEVPGGFAAWRFGPDGLVFAAPATLRLRGLDTATAAMTGLATQDADGAWRPATVVASAGAGEVAFQVPHFSDWAFYERFNLSPERATVRVGETAALNAFAIARHCVDGSSNNSNAECLLTPLAGNANVVRWTVNGVVGGNAQVGTLSVSSPGRAIYTAPAQVPAANPVAISAHVVDPHGGQIQLVSQLRVQPAGVRWSGEIKLSFFGLRVDHDSTAQGRHQVRFEATHAVDEVSTDAPGDDGAVTASLRMTVPTIDYRYQYGFKEPGFESLSELASRRAALDFYDAEDLGYRPALTLNAFADGRMQVPVGTLLAYLHVRGQRVESHYDGTTGQTRVSRFELEQPVSVGPDLGSVPTGVMLRHPITGAPLGELPGTFEGRRIPGAGEVWSGDTTLEGVELVIEGQTIPGTLRAQWQFTRRQP